MGRRRGGGCAGRRRRGPQRITGSIGLRPTSAAWSPGRSSRSPTRSRSSSAGRWSRRWPDPARSSPWTPSTRRSPRACAAGGRRRCAGSWSRPAGSFRGRSREEGHSLTRALAHPNFAMGRVITTNSATLVNKGLEVIEAHLLFDIPFERIDVVVHPQQMIHSMVEFHDGSTIAQMGPPRMLVPIASACPGPSGSRTSTCRATGRRRSPGTSPRSTTRPSRPSAWPASRAAGGTYPAVLQRGERGRRRRVPRRQDRLPRHRRHRRAGGRRAPGESAALSVEGVAGRRLGPLSRTEGVGFAGHGRRHSRRSRRRSRSRRTTQPRGRSRRGAS